MLHLRTLGELRLSGAGGELLAGRRKELVLLAYLARRSPRPVRREELIGLFWGEREDARARQSLRQALLRLRRAVGEGLTVHPDAVQLADGALELDSRAFEMELAAGRPRDAVERWGGEFLHGADEAGGETFRAWLEAEREGLRRRLASSFDQLVAASAAAGGWAEAAGWAERWAELLPLDERAHLRWIEALERGGRAEEALVRHAAFAARLRRELGVEPSPEFVRLATTLGRAGARTEPPPLASPGSAALFTPDLVGRDAALAVLAAAWRTVEQGGAATVVVEGGDGMGKTLLCEQFLHPVEGRASAQFVLRARARDEERDLAWASARALLAALPDAPGLGGAPDRELASVSRLVPAIRGRFPRLPEPAADDRGLAAAAARVLAAVAEEAPVAVFLDDLPYADPASRELVLWLARHPQPGVLLLVTARVGSIEPSGALAGLYQFPGVRRIKLAPLGAAEVEALLHSMIALPGDECRALAARLHAETGGNPFYAAEIVGAMVDEGQLAADSRGVWQIAPALAGQPLPLPASVRDAVGRRLARLSDAAQRVAGAAAALVEPSGRDALSRKSALPPGVFEAALDELIARRLLRPAPGTADAIEFAHPVIRRVARDRLGAAHRPRDRPGPAWWSTRRAALAAAMVVAALAALGAVMLRDRAPAAAPVIAVGQLAHSGVDAAGVADAIATMLATNLARVPELQVVSSARMYELLAQLGGDAAWASAARQAGAVELLEGELHRTGAGLRLDLRRVDLRTGTVRAGYTVVGADAFELVDRATAEIGADFGLPAAAPRLAEATTSSFVAYRFYEEGLRSYAGGDFREAVRLFDTALAEDSSFAMAAHYAMASREALFVAVPADARRSLVRRAGRATDRERLLIRGVWGKGEVSERVAIAETLAIRYPTDPDGHLLLGRALLSIGDFTGARPHLERVVAMDSLGLLGAHAHCRACEALSNIVNSYMLADSAAAAERVVREWLRLQPRSARAWHALAEVLESQDRYAEALAARRTATEIAPGHHYNAIYPVIARIRAGDFTGADRQLLDLARGPTSEMRLEAHWFLTLSLRHQGRLREALETVHQARRRDPAGPNGSEWRQHQAQVLFEMGRAAEAARLFDSVATLAVPGAAPTALARHRSWSLTHRATALAAAGDTVALRALADSIQSSGRRSSYGRDRYLHHHVRGLLLAARGDHGAAEAAFRRAIYSPTLGYTRTNLELARTLLAQDRPHEAVPMLRSALRGPLEASNLYVTHTELHEMLGRAWDAAGRPDSAAVHYRRVLQAWSAADPQLHGRRERVRARLVALGVARASGTD